MVELFQYVLFFSPLSQLVHIIIGIQPTASISVTLATTRAYWGVESQSSTTNRGLLITFNHPKYGLLMGINMYIHVLTTNKHSLVQPVKTCPLQCLPRCALLSKVHPRRPSASLTAANRPGSCTVCTATVGSSASLNYALIQAVRCV